MRIDVLCSDPRHPILPGLVQWCDAHGATLHSDMGTLEGGEFLFLISCQQLIGPALRARYRHTLVLHASDLPAGRGMSPHVWQVLEGAGRITVTLLDAADPVDSGDIWQQLAFTLDGHELCDEINARLFAAEFELMEWALAHCDSCAARPQAGEPSHYRRRRPEDSRIDPHKPLAEQFNLLRVADPERYPAFFELHGHRYEIVLRKVGEVE
ncbi:formyltransferase family protein [Pseudomonas sp. PDM13]|uniref:formyltransferase family protein n=1 Tax=Pseudomonas sp. PDM13 TaxID=2769255 RepID=UPI0021DF6526|nr:formyltransferase family protein [Pseudomonas sp. PDM13]MCU9948568.1 formyltransferase family protein [Pseudomonas sp. PDM13]